MYPPYILYIIILYYCIPCIGMYNTYIGIKLQCTYIVRVCMRELYTVAFRRLNRNRNNKYQQYAKPSRPRIRSHKGLHNNNTYVYATAVARHHNIDFHKQHAAWTRPPSSSLIILYTYTIIILSTCGHTI